MKKIYLRKKKVKSIIGLLVGATLMLSNLSTLPVYAFIDDEIAESVIQSNYGLYNTNLEWDPKFEPVGTGEWALEEEGLSSNSTGDSFMYSNTIAKDFVYSAKVKFNEVRGAASLVIRSDKKDDIKNSYVLNINVETKEARVFKFENNRAIDLVESKSIEVKSEYVLKAIAVDKHIVFYIDDQLIASTADYTIENIGLGQNDAILEGYLGLLTFNSNVTYQDVYYSEINESNTPVLNELIATPVKGELESKFNLKKNQYMYINYASNDCDSIDLNPISNGKEIKTTILDSNGAVVNGELPLQVGRNIYTIISENGEGAKVIYSIVIYRRQASYYDEEYRGQYHYSVKEGWANDPNGMVYFNSEYHLFYQYYDNGTNWGPMHWGHTVSKDLIHWEDQPIEFYPDEYGTMFSGCAVVDEDNSSGLFSSEKGGLIALITTDGNGQRVIAAYSEDGYNWEKYDGVLIDWTEDPLNDAAFRDPKVFKYEDKWFMVIAGGPLRIYSSDNLLDWKVESTYKDLHTECPDLYRLPLVEDNGNVEYKWVLSRGGRYYKVGDFTEVNGSWEFIPDKEYEGNDNRNDGIMNFGRDSYAAMTYYKNDFNYEDRGGAVDDIIEINWMNTWDDYCNLVDDASGNRVFNGTFNLQLKLGLTRDESGKIVLTQTPIAEYDTLKNSENNISLNNALIKPGENLLKDFKGKSYNIIANFKPEEGTKEVGFNVQVGINGEKTEVKYNFETKEISIDRSKSGIIPTNKFSEVMKQSVEEKADGSIDLTLYVDRSSVEVFTQNYTVAGAAQIFSSEISDGIEVFSIGGNSRANIDIHEMDSIWQKNSNNDKQIKLSSTNIEMYSNKKYDLFYNVFGTDNKEISVEVEDPTIAKAIVSNEKIIIEGLSKGETTLKVKLKDDESIYKVCKVKINEDNFITNLSGWKSVMGNWKINDDFYECKTDSNAFAFAENKAENDKYTYELDVKRNGGLINIIFGAQTTSVFDGCYAVQLVDNKIRLFDFKEDHTFAIIDYNSNESEIEKVKIDVDGTNIKVSVDDVQYIDINVNRIYNKGYFGVGVYNSFGQFSNIKVTGAYNFNDIVTSIEDLNCTQNSTLEEISSKLPGEVQLSDVNGNLINSVVNWDYSNLNVGKPGEYLITGSLDNGLELKVKVIISKIEENPYQKHLEIAVEEANKIIESELENVIPIVVIEFKAALEEAKTVLDKIDATQTEINASWDRLSKVMQMLSFIKGDKTHLNDLINRIDTLDKDEFIKSTWNKLEKSLLIAKQVAIDENAMQNEVNKTYDNLMRQFLELRLKPNKDKLEELINKSESLNEKDYTKSSWKELEKQLEKAKVVFANEEATEVEIKESEELLELSINSLVKVNSGDSNGGSNGNSGNLPNTGGTSAVAVALFGLALSVAGISLFKRKNNELD